MANMRLKRQLVKILRYISCSVFTSCHFNRLNECRSVDCVCTKATGNSRTGIPGNSRESPTPTIPGGNSREFLKLWRELRGIYRSYVFFSIFVADYDILAFNLTHCIMCTTHARWAYRILSKTLNDVSDPTFCVYRVPVYSTFKYWYRKITGQRQNFANSDRYTNVDADSSRS